MKNQFENQYGWFGGRINQILCNKKDDFYISYNNTDIAIYGCDTTALVKGQMQHFYILNGDHREKYAEIIEHGFDKCMEYFKENIHQINKNSEGKEFVK